MFVCFSYRLHRCVARASPSFFFAPLSTCSKILPDSDDFLDLNKQVGCLDLDEEGRIFPRAFHLIFPSLLSFLDFSRIFLIYFTSFSSSYSSFRDVLLIDGMHPIVLCQIDTRPEAKMTRHNHKALL
jgi:hypothetical protein